jgi:hypothetical protein
MELLKLVKEMQSEEYKHKLRRESFEHLCGYYLTEFQVGVLMADTVNNSQTIYAAQDRNTGTSTALLFKVYQSIFLEDKLNEKYVISKSNNQASYMKNQMMNLLGRANLLDQVRRNSRYRIELNNGCIIYFENHNPLNLRGIRTGPEFFFDDYVLSDEQSNAEFNNIVSSAFPTHCHYFLASEQFNQEFTQLLFS